MEARSCEVALRSHLKPGSHVAEFACENGFMSRKLLEWGCASVVGADLSPAMVQDAQRILADHIAAGRAEFSVADATIPQSVAPDGSLGYFDVVVGAWLLNHSPDSASLVAMFANVALNLKEDGFFFGVVPHPTNDLEEGAARYRELPFSRFEPKLTYTSPLASGQGWNLHGELANDAHVDVFHLEKDVVEEFARLRELKGRLEWKTEVFPGDSWKREYNATLTDHDWYLRSLSPYFGILIVYKK